MFASINNSISRLNFKIVSRDGRGRRWRVRTLDFSRIYARSCTRRGGYQEDKSRGEHLPWNRTIVSKSSAVRRLAMKTSSPWYRQMYSIRFLRFQLRSFVGSFSRLLSSRAPPLPLSVRTVVTAVARCNDSGSLRKLPITLVYCMQVTERISRSGVVHDLPEKRSEEKETSGDTSVFSWKVGTAWRRKEKENESKRAENVARRLDVET